MYKTAGGSTLIAIVLSSLFSYGGHAWTGWSPAPAVSASASKSGSDEASSPEQDGGRCYPFEAVLRHLGKESPGRRHPTQLTCDAAALPREPQPGPKAAMAAASSAIATAAVTGDATATVYIKVPGAALAKPAGTPKQLRVFNGKILIATVPDPLETSDALEFDRAISALQEAGTAAGYHFELMVTPWLLSDLEEPTSVKAGREAAYYRRAFGDEPGAMLFRCDNAGGTACPASQLLLLLVPESPSYGLNFHAAEEALAAYDALMRNQCPDPNSPHATDMCTEWSDPVRWIGPEYSASAASLLQLSQDDTRPGKSRPFCALSGSVTRDDAVRQLKRINNACSSSVKGEPTLSTLDLDALDVLLRQPVFGDPANNSIAVLEEDETAYGAGLPFSEKSAENDRRTQLNTARKNVIRQFRFPRGIAHVRGLYGKSLRDASAAALAQERSSLPNPAMDFSDALQQPLDTGEEFAAQSPVSDESILASIAESLAHLHASAVVILATDPLDQLFLARYFHRHVPNSRLVIFQAERLLPRLRGEFDLDGTIVVTRFPLFQDAYLQAEELPDQNRFALSFTSSNQEAEFLAALKQMTPHHISQRPFDGGEQELATWIGVSGGGAFWPVAYQQAQQATDFAACCEQAHAPQEPNQSFVLVDTPNESLPLLWVGVLEAVLLACTLHVLFFAAAGPFNQWLNEHPSPRLRKLARHRLLSFYFLSVYFPGISLRERRRRMQCCLGQCWWLINVTLIFFLVVCYLLLPSIVYRARMGAQSFCTIVTVFLFGSHGLNACALLVLLLLASLVIWLVIIFINELWLFGKTNWFLLLGPPIVWTGCSLHWFCVQLADTDMGWAFSLRCLHLSSGVCPILPLILASAAMLAAAAANLNMLTLHLGRYPGLPSIKLNTLDIYPWRARLNRYVEFWIQLPGADGMLLLVGLLVTGLMFHPSRAFASFDDAAISHLYLMTFAVCLWLVLTLFLRFFKMWGVLRFCLESLESSPLRFAFSRLPKAFSPGPVWSYAGLRRQIVLPTRTLEFLRVAPTPGDPLYYASIEVSGPRLTATLAAVENFEQVDNVTYRLFNAVLNRYAVRLLKHPWVRNAWAHGGPDIVTDAAARPPSTNDLSATIQPREDVPRPCRLHLRDGEECYVGRANEYIAVRIVIYVRYYMLHLKSMMTFMSAATFFLILAAVSYPFNEPHAILWGIASLVAGLLVVVGMVLAQMDRDAILSRLSETSIGKLNWGTFLPQFTAAGGLPALTVLASVFPTLGNALLSLLRPVLQSLH